MSSPRYRDEDRRATDQLLDSIERTATDLEDVLRAIQLVAVLLALILAVAVIRLVIEVA